MWIHREKHPELCIHPPPARINNAEEKLRLTKVENINTEWNEIQYTQNKGQNHGKLEDTEQTFLSLFGFSGNFSHYTKAKTKHKQIFMGYCIAKKRINLFR